MLVLEHSIRAIVLNFTAACTVPLVFQNIVLTPVELDQLFKLNLMT